MRATQPSTGRLSACVWHGRAGRDRMSRGFQPVSGCIGAMPITVRDIRGAMVCEAWAFDTPPILVDVSFSWYNPPGVVAQPYLLKSNPHIPRMGVWHLVGHGVEVTRLLEAYYRSNLGLHLLSNLRHFARDAIVWETSPPVPYAKS